MRIGLEAWLAFPVTLLRLLDGLLFLLGLLAFIIGLVFDLSQFEPIFLPENSNNRGNGCWLCQVVFKQNSESLKHTRFFNFQEDSSGKMLCEAVWDGIELEFSWSWILGVFLGFEILAFLWTWNVMVLSESSDVLFISFHKSMQLSLPVLLNFSSHLNR